MCMIAFYIFMFANPVHDSVQFAVGLVLVLSGELIRILAAGHLQKNQFLTVTGPYSHVKNPLYLGTFMVGVGVCLVAWRGGAHGNFFLDNAGLIALGVFIIGFLLYYAPYKKNVEYDRLREIYGEDWNVYEKNVPDYIPRLTPFKHPNAELLKNVWTAESMKRNSEHWTCMFVLLYAAAVSFNREILAFLSQ